MVKPKYATSWSDDKGCKRKALVEPTYATSKSDDKAAMERLW